jgi:hypothetical protein
MAARATAVAIAVRRLSSNRTVVLLSLVAWHRAEESANAGYIRIGMRR